MVEVCFLGPGQLFIMEGYNQTHSKLGILAKCLPAVCGKQGKQFK